MSSIRERLDARDALDLRGDGKAGGGLVLCIQSFGVALGAEPDLDVQNWPLFSSARKGANVRAFLRVARGRVDATCQITSPDIAILMNEAAGEEIDFAEGTASALYVINTAEAPEEAAKRWRLGGTIVTIAADELGLRHLARPLGNVGVFAALVRSTGLVTPERGRASLEQTLARRHIPERLIAANLSLFDEALARTRSAEVPANATTDHRRARFAGYGALPVGAQAALRSSRHHRTAGYGRPGVRIEFADPGGRCNGCSLCVAACPEGIIDFTADPARGAIVHGARFDDFCKVCRECIAACPLDLFTETHVIARPIRVLEES
jgi:Pyruvate/2-oxoacid:ferredoxin oxidoreductase gamma subunit/NAD-dependent dihydropyrimidine dehydrogenase PreA subunit